MAETSRLVAPSELPADAVCALTADGHLTRDDAWQIARFTRLLADKAEVMAEYAATLDPITPAHAYAALRPIPAGHADDPDVVRLWGERAKRLRALMRAYDAGILPTEDGEDAFERTICEGSGLADSAGGPILGCETDAEEGAEPADGDHATCATCGAGIRYQACPTGGWRIHDTHPADGHDALLGGPA